MCREIHEPGFVYSVHIANTGARNVVHLSPKCFACAETFSAEFLLFSQQQQQISRYFRSIVSQTSPRFSVLLNITTV